jgi:chromosome segregation ATPase
MIFGKGDKPEKIDSRELSNLLDSLLDRKLRNLDSKASGIAKELPRARLQFSNACKRFEELDVEPEKRNIYIDNIAFVKGQKNFYSKALKHIIDDWDISIPNASNTHEKYSAMLMNIEKFIAEILKANTSFKNVLYSYANHLDEFKGSFSHIERLRNSLKNELSKTETEISEYKAIMDQISKLGILENELEGIEKDIDAFNEHAASGNAVDVNEKIAEVSKVLADKRNELAFTIKEGSNIINRINSVTSRLERSARKFDHVSKRKRRLGDFITDPIGSIKSESDYADFKMLVEELRKSVDSDVVDVKNNERVRHSINELLDADIYSMIKHFDDVQNKKSELEHAVKSLDMMLYKLKDNVASSEREIGNIELMRNNAADLRTKIDSTRSRIESLFLEYYNKRLSIVMDLNS